jgi:hypothetical protein
MASRVKFKRHDLARGLAASRLRVDGWTWGEIADLLCFANADTAQRAARDALALAPIVRPAPKAPSADLDALGALTARVVLGLSWRSLAALGFGDRERVRERAECLAFRAGFVLLSTGELDALAPVSQVPAVTFRNASGRAYS